MSFNQEVTGDLSTSAVGSRVTGFFGQVAQAVRGYLGGAVRGIPGGTDVVYPPVADFSAATLSGTAPLTVNFVNLSTNAATFAWSSGDGQTSSQRTPTFVYSTAGAYSPSLTVSNSGGSDTKTRTAYISVSGAQQPSLATLQSPGAATVNAPATFTVNLDRAATQAMTVTWSVPGATLSGVNGSSQSTIGSGQTATSITATWSSAQTASVDFTISPTVTRAGRPASVTVATVNQAGVLPSVTLSSTTAGTKAYSYGQSFAPGAVPAGLYLSANDADFDAAPLNYWPDGSLKFAVLSGQKFFAAANTTYPVALTATATAPTGAAVTTSDLIAANPTALIEFGATSASWSGSDWNAPFRQVLSSRQMSAWQYRKALGGDAHLVAWLEVRCYKSGAVEVLPWIENGYLSVASPQVKSGRAKFTLSGSLRYDSISDANTPGAYTLNPVVGADGTLSIQHHSRHALVRGGNFSYWQGAAPGVAVNHDRAYLASTRVVPSYHPSAISESALAALTLTYSPGRVCYMERGMGATGYAEEIGVLPNVAAMYLVSGDSRAYLATISSGLSLGNYSIHYRDQSTNRPILFASRPSASIDDVPSDNIHAAVYASSHHPAAAYLPYLLTGWNWFAEEIQFQTTDHYLARNPAYRKNATFYFYPSAFGSSHNEQGGHRAQAWVLRTCAMAASTTPDADTSMRGQFVAALTYNATKFRTEYESGDSDNLFGANTLGVTGFGWQDSSIVDADAAAGWPAWQSAFFAASVGLAWDLQVVSDPTAQSNLRWVRDFAYRGFSSLLGRSGVVSEYSFTRAANYQNLKVGQDLGSTFSWRTSWGDVWMSTWGSPNTDVTANTLVGGNINSNGFSTSYWGNIMPAVAYAVDHGAPGARSGLQRLQNATNWSAGAVEWSSIPVWGVRPGWVPPYSLPTVGQAAHIETITGPSSSHKAVKPSELTTEQFTRALAGSYGSGVFCSEYSLAGAFITAGSGGHGHPELVDAVGFDFTTGSWFRLANANGAPNLPPPGYVPGVNSTGSPWFEASTGSEVPAPPHPYSCAVYIPPSNGGGYRGSFAYGVRNVVGQGAEFSPTAHRFDLTTRAWSRLVSAPGVNLGDGVNSEYRCVFDPATSRIYIVPRALHYFNVLPFVSTTSVTTYGTIGTGPFPPDSGSDGLTTGLAGAVLDPKRRLIVRTLQRKLRALDLNNPTGGWQLVSLSNSTLLPNNGLGDSEIVYHEANDAFYYLPSTGGQTIYKISPPATNPYSAPWVVTQQVISGATIYQHGNDGLISSGSAAYKCLMYVPALGMLAWVPFGQHTSGGNSIYPVTLINPS